MSRLFGPIRQNGYVVRDLEAAMRHWAEALQVGPFFHLPHVAAEEFVYRGESAAVDISIGLAFSGELQIEFIQHGTLPGGLRFAYFDTELHAGTVFEISNLTAEPFKPMLDAMQDAVRTWDGSDPVRSV